jgi:Txe/YoeB family toxin of Txe-Axe toxin-antitoxin module
VLLHLKANNITKYEIISSPDEKIKKQVSQLVKQEGEAPLDVTLIADLVVKDKEQMSNRLDRIEGLLKKLFNKKPEVIVKEVETIKEKLKRKEPEIEDVGTFIPSVNIAEFKSTNETDRTISTKRDFNENVELLKKLKK